jgi:hypothetical protein
VVPVADHQTVAVGVELVSMCLDVGADLGLQRRREHPPPSTVTDQFVQQGPAHPSRDVFVGAVLLGDYLKHVRTFPNQRVNAARDQSHLVLKIILGKVRSFTSPGRRPSTGSDLCSVLGCRTYR